MWINEELLEARYYRNLGKQYGKTVNDLASSIFDHLLMDRKKVKFADVCQIVLCEQIGSP